MTGTLNSLLMPEWLAEVLLFLYSECLCLWEHQLRLSESFVLMAENLTLSLLKLCIHLPPHMMKLNKYDMQKHA